MPLADIGTVVLDNLPILVPEIVSLYKAHEQTDKHDADFRVALPYLDSSAKGWLLDVLVGSLTNHPWSAKLRDQPGP
jgi:hypothetical protein